MIPALALGICLLLLLRGLFWGEPSPGRSDPVHLISDPPVDVLLTGRVLADARPWDESCSALLAVSRINGRRHEGRTELILRPCPKPPLQGWRLQVEGALRRPSSGPHPLLNGAAERLSARSCWSRLTATHFELLGRRWTPIADLRRRIAIRFQQLAGRERGGLLAALVLGSAQVQLPAELRQIFRVAGLSHALAASGFHLSVLMGAALVVSRRWTAPSRLGLAFLAMLLFLLLAGSQPSVVRAVLMVSMALLIRETGHRPRGFRVLLVAISLMLLFNPAWARSIGFQLSAAATAGLIVTSPDLEQWLAFRLPGRWHGLAQAFSVPLAAIAWTLPLQLLHFGSTPLYALIANLLAAPLLAPLTLSALGLALLTLFLPSGVLLVLSWPVSQLAGLLIALVQWISHWPAAQLLTGYPQPWVVALLALGLIPWLVPQLVNWRRMALLPLFASVVLQGLMQCRDELVRVQRFQDHWLLARHRGRGALISTASDAHACRTARRLSEARGHARLDWVMVLDPVASDAQSCWRSLARWVQSPQLGQQPLAKGQRLFSEGLELELLADRGQPMLLRVGDQRWRLFPRPQSLWALQDAGLRARDVSHQNIWLGFEPSAAQRRWLKRSRLWVGH